LREKEKTFPRIEVEGFRFVLLVMLEMIEKFEENKSRYGIIDHRLWSLQTYEVKGRLRNMT